MENTDRFIGSSLGPYRLIEYLGQGAMARVYKAIHPELRRYAAIKILRPHFSSDQEFTTLFQGEAQNLALLRHPNIVQVYDASIAGSFPYIIMEFIHGKTLKQFITEYQERQIRIPMVRTMRIVYSVGLALAYAHQKNMIHRDVKPANIILEDAGRVVLTDFGLSRLISHLDGDASTGFSGTPAYIAPEQALGKVSKPRADIYSLGVIFFEMLTGRQPYEAQNPMAVAMQHITGEVPAPKDFFPEIPDEINNIVRQATAKNTNQRYSTMNEFLQDLTKVRLKVRTARLPTASLTFLQDSPDQVSQWAPPDQSEPKAGKQVSLNFLDTGQVISLELNREYAIGRRHKSQPIIPDIDLSPFKAYDWGISRLHANLNVTREHVSVTDLGSSNGTWHAGARIPPNEPYVLEHGDLIHLGKLKIQILIYEKE
ncbi:MAG: FHA domain-containing serine/threonine-protein kinase [Chloroflexota bacterium]